MGAVDEGGVGWVAEGRAGMERMASGIDGGD